MSVRRPTRRNARGAPRREAVAVDAAPSLPTTGLIDAYLGDEAVISGASTWPDANGGTTLVKGFANDPASDTPIDGRATVRFSASAGLEKAGDLIAQPWSVYAIVRPGLLTATRLLHDAVGSTNRSTCFHGSGTTLTMSAGANLVAPSGTLAENRVHSLRLHANGASSAIYVTDLVTTPVATGNAGTGSWDGLTLGTGNGGSNAWTGSIAAWLRYDGTEDPAEVQAYLDYWWPSHLKRAWAASVLLCAGDSMTTGTGSTDTRGIRSLLRETFETADVEDGVRTLVFAGPTDDSAMDHYGTSGALVADVAAGIGAHVTTYSPEIVLLMAGTNDCRNHAGHTYDGPTDAASLGDALEAIYAADATTKVAVFTVPPQTNGANDANVDDYNARLGAVVTTQQGAGQDVGLYDLNALLTAGSHLDGDGVHLNDAGYAIWHDLAETAIRELLA